MFNIFRFVSVVAITVLLFSGCKESSVENNTIVGSGKIISEIRNVDDCNGIEIFSAGNIYLTQDSTQTIRIEADDNIIDNVITRKENGILIAGLEQNSYSNITLKIYVSQREIEKLSIIGAGNIQCLQPIHSENLYCLINGAGNIKLAGNGNYLDCSINGAGNINAEEFIVKDCKANVNGAGNCTLYVTENLDAVVAGVGSITYYGNPKNVTTSITGVGQIIRK